MRDPDQRSTNVFDLYFSPINAAEIEFELDVKSHCHHLDNIISPWVPDAKTQGSRLLVDCPS